MLIKLSAPITGALNEVFKLLGNDELGMRIPGIEKCPAVIITNSGSRSTHATGQIKWEHGLKVFLLEVLKRELSIIDPRKSTSTLNRCITMLS